VAKSYPQSPPGPARASDRAGPAAACPAWEWLSAGTKGPRCCDWAFIEASDRAVTNGCSRIVLLDIPESELPPRTIRYRAFPDPHTVTFCNELPGPV